MVQQRHRMYVYTTMCNGGLVTTSGLLQAAIYRHHTLQKDRTEQEVNQTKQEARSAWKSNLNKACNINICIQLNNFRLTYYSYYILLYFSICLSKALFFKVICFGFLFWLQLIFLSTVENVISFQGYFIAWLFCLKNVYAFEREIQRFGVLSCHTYDVRLCLYDFQNIFSIE